MAGSFIYFVCLFKKNIIVIIKSLFIKMIKYYLTRLHMCYDCCCFFFTILTKIKNLNLSERKKIIFWNEFEMKIKKRKVRRTKKQMLILP